MDRGLYYKYKNCKYEQSLYLQSKGGRYNEERFD